MTSKNDVNVPPYTIRPRTNLGNFIAIKKVLDEELLALSELNGYREVHVYTDIHNVIVLCSVACGCLAQFWFVFPDDFWGIAGCIAGYGFFTFLANCVDWFVAYAMKGSAFILTKNIGEAKDKAKAEQHNGYCVGVKSELGELQPKWKVTWTSRVATQCKYEAVIDIRSMFDVNGEFVRRNFNKELSKHWAAFVNAFNKNKKKD